MLLPFTEALAAFWTALSKVLATVFAAQASAIGGLADALIGTPRAPRRSATYEERLHAITTNLRHSAADAQNLLEEMERVVGERADAVARVEASVAELESKEREAAQRLELLQSVEPEAAAALAALVDESLEQRDRRSGKRDYVIFLLGVAFSVVLFVVQQVFFD